MAEAASAPPLVPSGDPVSELTRAERWLAAFRRGDLAALQAQSRYPFELRDTGEQGHCPGRRTASDAASLGATLACLLDDELLASLLRTHPETAPRALPEGFISSWAARWRGERRPDEKAVTVHVSRPDASFTFILLIAHDGVRSLWKTGTDATAEVALATRWLQALRQRDLPALERMTHYPFDVRQTAPTPICESRTAPRASDLRRAIECLLADEAFSRALSQSAKAAVEAGPTRAYVPDVFEGWGPVDRGELWPTLLHLETSDDLAIDLLLLVAKDGVQTAWKRTGFPPPLPHARGFGGPRPRPPGPESSPD
jgi:hypothetical protein